MTPRRICIITTGHLASCPRMLKAADAFVAAGHEVHVVMIRSGGWGAEADARLCARRRWHPHVVSYDRTDSPVRWVWSGVRQQAALALGEFDGLDVAAALATLLVDAESPVATAAAESG